MSTQGANQRSIYVSLAIVILVAVGAVMALNTLYSYTKTRHLLEEQLQRGMEHSLVAVEKNITGLILAYAPNEYAQLVANEMDLRDSLAIVVDDFKMGEITGEPTYRSGSIRDANWDIVEFDPQNPEHLQRLSTAYLSQQRPVQDVDGNTIGRITHYASDRNLRNRLEQLLYENLLESLAITLLLIATLFLAIRQRLLQPLAHIVETITHTDADGIPHDAIACDGPREVALLSRTINRMIAAIDQSRRELKNQHEALREERERFSLAIEGTLDGLFDWNLHTNHLYHSPRFETMLGYEVGELPDTIEAWEGLLHPDDAEDAHRRVKEYLETGGKGIYESTFRMRTKGGDWCWITGRGKAVFDENGKAARFVGFNTDVTKLVEQRQQLQEQKDLLQYQANHDPLTGLANRTLFNDRLTQGIAKARRHHSKLALLFIDLDNFKHINDTLGHRTGDKVLNLVTQRLQQVIRSEDTLARLGGDEFTIVLEGLREEQDASVLAEKVIHALGHPLNLESKELYVGCSIGISIYPANGVTARDLLKNADAAMYKAKNEGRNNYQYYSAEMTTLAFERVHLEAGLRAGLKKDEFLVYYQPQIHALTHRVIGVEALVRWQSPEMGLVSPARFIPVAESSGLIVELDRWVMHRAMRQLMKWHEQGLQHGVLSLNLSVKQLQQKDFLASLVESLTTTQCSPDWIEFEVTEGQVMDNPEEAIKMLGRIDDLGVKLALDDFGTGYSSLAYLKRLPISKLKIDQSFVRDLPHDPEDAAIARAVIALARSLDLTILAEGTENQEQIDFLIENGCENMQGYFYSKPLPAKEMTEFLSRMQGENVRQLYR